MLVVINESSGGARGAQRWRAVRERLVGGGLVFEEAITESAEAAARAIVDGVSRGHDVIVAAGGDGTVNAALNALIDPTNDRSRRDVAFGAIGLGSSNDFHKPFADERTLGGVPVRVRHDQSTRVDVGKARLVHEDGTETIRYFILNASVGVVAEGNAFFNDGDRANRWLKAKSTETAILYSALVNLWRYRPSRVAIEIDGNNVFDDIAVNVGVLKHAYFAGGMHYDTPVRPDDGLFDVNVWGAMGRARILEMVAGLYRGRFQGKPRTRSFRGVAVRLTPTAQSPIELDGETFRVRAAELTVVPKALKVCV